MQTTRRQQTVDQQRWFARLDHLSRVWNKWNYSSGGGGNLQNKQNLCINVVKEMLDEKMSKAEGM